MRTKSNRTNKMAAFVAVFVATAVAEHKAAMAQTEPGAAAGAATAAPERGVLYEIKPEPAVLRPRLRFQSLDRKKGLPQDTVAALAQDPTGFMWLGTADGLARYDGQRFRIFRNEPNNPDSISSSFISALLVAEDGTLWAGTTGGGVNRYQPDTETFERFLPTDAEDTLDEGTILALGEGPDGRIWIGTNGAGLAALDPKSGKVQTYGEDNGVPVTVTSILAGEKSLWVGTPSGLYRFDPEKQRAVRMFNDRSELGGVISELVEDKSGNLWIGTDGGGVTRYTPEGEKLKTFRADPEDPNALYEGGVRAIMEDDSGRIWVGTDNALNILDTSTGRFGRHLVNRDIPGALPGRTVALFQDKAGLIWVGTHDEGAVMLDPLSLDFDYYATKNTSGVFHKGNMMWVVTASGACRWQGKESYEGVCYPVGFALTVLVDRHGTVWIGTWAEGLFRLDKESTDRWRVYEHDPGDAQSVAPGLVTTLYEDPAGNLWVGTLGGGMQRFDRQRNAFIGSDIPSNQIYTIKGDPKNDDVLWVSTADQGLFRLETSSGKIDQFLPVPDDPSNRTDNAIVDFTFEGDDTIWLASYGGGLKHFDRKSEKFKSYRRGEGMPSDTIYSVVQDKSGKLWLSSIAGIARFDPKTETVHIFTEADGLQSDEFIVRSGTKLDDGQLFFGGVNGFNIFNPEDIEIDEFSPPVVLTSISVLGEKYRPGKRVDALDKLDLDYDESFIELEFASLSYSASDRLSYEYKVKGLNDKWFPASTASVSLPGLKDGDYTMLLRARNRHGVESEPTSLAITVDPPPWRTWWALTLYALLAVVIVIALLRLQQRRAKAKIEAVEIEARLAFTERELELTAAVQTGFLPEVDTVKDDGMSLAGYYVAADQCSGDWWWYEKISDTKHLILVGDVTGHGAAPAMVTASVSTTFRVLRHVWTESGADEFLRTANQQVLSSGRGQYLMQLMAAELDTEAGQLTLYSAAGLPALCLLDGKRKLVSVQGSPLGSPEFEIGHATIDLAPGDRFMLLTDGIAEIARPDGRPWGLDRVGRVYQEAAELPLSAATEHIVAAARALNPEQREQKDDWTFVITEFTGAVDQDEKTAVRS